MFSKSRAQAAALFAMMMAPIAKRGGDVPEIVIDEYSPIVYRQPRHSKDWRETSNKRENERRKRQINIGWHPVIYSAQDHRQRV